MYILDISNLKDYQIRAAVAAGDVVLVSTHKQFNYRANLGELPLVPPGTRWRCVCIPTGRGRPKYDAARQRFKYVPLRSGSPKIKYGRKTSRSHCQMLSTRNTEIGRASHGICEYDDYVIYRMARRTGDAVLTNDKRLQAAILAGAYKAPPEFRVLTPYVDVVDLRLRADGRWYP